MATQPSNVGHACPASVNIATLQNDTGRHECHTQNKRDHLAKMLASFETVLLSKRKCSDMDF